MKRVSLVVLLFVGCKPAPAPELRVAAASDLTDAFGELGKLYEARTGQKVVFSFGSTGLLAKQLKEGAPFDLFAAANVSFVDEVVKAGACDGATQALYAHGRVAVWSKKGTVAPATSLVELTDARFTKLALANPDHAPYGIAAREALQRAGVWDALQPRLVFGENVRGALQFAQSGNVDVALVALSLVVSDQVNPWFLVDEALHAPLAQALVVCRRGQQAEGAKKFAALVASPEGAALMKRYGFVLPDARRPASPRRRRRAPSPCGSGVRVGVRGRARHQGRHD